MGDTFVDHLCPLGPRVLVMSSKLSALTIRGYVMCASRLNYYSLAMVPENPWCGVDVGRCGTYSSLDSQATAPEKSLLVRSQMSTGLLGYPKRKV